MISHDRAQELISARMDVPLAAAEHRELQRHLAACDACRDFVNQADDLARGLQVLPRLAPSPAVSRAVMEAVRADTPGWGWLRRSLQTLSSPGMAVASGLALVVVLAGTLIIALNAPGSDGNLAAEPESTIAAVAIAPLPTEPPTKIPTTEPAPTATRAALRTVAPAPTKEAATSPSARPTATHVAIIAAAEPTAQPAIEPAIVEQPSIEPAAEDPTLAMAVEDPVDTAAEAELAQAAEPPAGADRASEAELAPATDDGSTNQHRRKDSVDEPAAQPVATEAIPDEAIAALENAGASTDVNLPPAAPLPMPPSQAFLPITPTPVSDGTPTPEPETQAEAPQLADNWSDDSGVTALAPEAPEATDAALADVTAAETDDSKSREKRDRSSKDGNSEEEQQAAYSDGAMGWSLAPV
ncbi:MAG TPA: zf-HC2 domain-containing protein, partial [Candidatus Limnocylindria bacterium]